MRLQRSTLTGKECKILPFIDLYTKGNLKTASRRRTQHGIHYLLQKSIHYKRLLLTAINGGNAEAQPFKVRMPVTGFLQDL
jgi:hypothetical protein